MHQHILDAPFSWCIPVIHFFFRERMNDFFHFRKNIFQMNQEVSIVRNQTDISLHIVGCPGISRFIYFFQMGMISDVKFKKKSTYRSLSQEAIQIVAVKARNRYYCTGIIKTHLSVIRTSVEISETLSYRWDVWLRRDKMFC